MLCFVIKAWGASRWTQNVSHYPEVAPNAPTLQIFEATVREPSQLSASIPVWL